MARATRQPRRTLRRDLVGGLALLIVLAAAALSLGAQYLTARRHAAQERGRLVAQAQAIATSLAPHLDAHGRGADGPNVERLLRASVADESVEGIRLVRARDGAVLYETGLVPADLPRPDPTAPATSMALDHGAFVLSAPVPALGSGPPAVVVQMVARPSSWTHPDALVQVFVPALGLGVVVAILAWLLVQRDVLAPLATVRRATSTLASGELGTRAPEDGPEEIRALAADFNRMAEALAELVERRAAERTLLLRSQNLATIGRVAAGVAHEVGNPLAAIAGYLAMLRDDLAGDEPRRALVERALGQVERIQGLVGQLLAYARPEPRSLARVDLADALRHFLSLLRHDPRLDGVTVTVETTGPCDLTTDAAAVEQIVRNLVVNGARAAREGPPPPAVTIRVHAHDGGVAVDVADSGPGVAADLRERIFEPFFTTSAAGEGTGLGLAISREIAGDLGGRLELLDGPAPPEGGALFRLWIPQGPAAPQADPPQKNHGTDPAGPIP